MTTTEHSPYEREQLARINATPAAPESWDANAAIRRVLALADDLDDIAQDYRNVPSGTHDAGARNAHMAIARRIRAAVATPYTPTRPTSLRPVGSGGRRRDTTSEEGR